MLTPVIDYCDQCQQSSVHKINLKMCTGKINRVGKVK